MTTDDQDEKITLATLLGGIWPWNPFMAELVRRTPTTLWELMDKADGFINADDTFWSLTALRKTKLGQLNRRSNTSR